VEWTFPEDPHEKRRDPEENEEKAEQQICVAQTQAARE
jgi:hypothetical protein